MHFPFYYILSITYYPLSILAILLVRNANQLWQELNELAAPKGAAY